MYLKRLEIRNYMVHRSTSIELDPVTVFVGPNNGGKSALFDALLNFSMVSRGRLSEAFGPGPFSFSARRHHGTSRNSRVGFETTMAESSTDERDLTYSVAYAQQGGGDAPRLAIYEEELRDSAGHVIFSRADPDSSTIPSALPYVTEDQTILAAIRRAQIAGRYEETDALVTHCAREVSKITRFRLDPHALAQPSKIPDVPTESIELSGLGKSSDPTYQTPRLDYRGFGLASVLYYLHATENPELATLIGELSDVLVGFDGFEFNSVETDRIGFSARFSDARGTVAAANLSDGTLSMLGLAVLLHGATKPPVMCIEEPENGLTPRSVRYLYEAIRAVAHPSAAAPSQILISSHSPFIITEAWNGPERDFIYQVKSDHGSAVVRRFRDVITAQGIHLAVEGGVRDGLSLRTADEVMAGYWS